jgi:cell division septal protein FtsQ
MARAAIPASKIKARRKRRLLIVFVVVVLALLAIVGGLVALMHADFMRISRITVTGTQTIATSSLVAYAERELAGSYLGIIPKDNIILYPKAAIAASLIEAFPVLASATVSASDFHSISILVVERKPKAQWCGVDASAPEPCFLLDENGAVYRSSLTFTDPSYIKYFGSISGSSPKQYLSVREFRALSALVDTIAASQKTERIDGVWVDTNRDVHLLFGSGFTLLFMLSSDGADIYQRFTLALQSDPFKTHALDDFSYLDLRFGDKLYYKFK